MSRLSNNPVTIRTQTDRSNAVLESFRAQLETVPDDDLLEQASLNQAIKLENGRLGKLKRHLLGLENEFDSMLEDSRVTPEQF